MVWMTNNSRITRKQPDSSTQWWRIWTQIWWGRQVKWWKTCHQNKWLKCSRWQAIWWVVEECQGWEGCQEWECLDRRLHSNLLVYRGLKLWQPRRKKFYQMTSKPIWTRLKIWRVPQTSCSRNKNTKRLVSNISPQLTRSDSMKDSKSRKLQKKWKWLAEATLPSVNWIWRNMTQ